MDLFIICFRVEFKKKEIHVLCREEEPGVKDVNTAICVTVVAIFNFTQRRVPEFSFRSNGVTVIF